MPTLGILAANASSHMKTIENIFEEARREREIQRNALAGPAAFLRRALPIPGDQYT
jgi:hypothetical protein